MSIHRLRLDGGSFNGLLDAVYPNPPAAFRRLEQLSDLTVMIAATTGMLREAMARNECQAVRQPSNALREEVDRQSRILTSPARRLAMQAMLRNALPLRNDGIPDWNEVERIIGNYARIDVPCLLVWGERDQCLPLSMGYKLATQIPGACLEIVPEGMHSPAIEQPYLCAGLIREFSENPSVTHAVSRARQYAAKMNQPPIAGVSTHSEVTLGAIQWHRPLK